ncbi:MAG: DinB family protein [Bryobacter sp.]|nr:DinB family protein [Bryobacter sp.]
MGFSFEQVGPHLRYLVGQGGARLRAAENLEEPYAPGKWTRKQLLGHLIDSVANNHQRMVRAMSAEWVAFPSYQQEEMVEVQRYREAEVAGLIALWESYNLHLAWVVEGMAPLARGNTVVVGQDAPLSLEQLTLDYVAHLEHHLRQLLGREALLWSGLPWGLS